MDIKHLREISGLNRTEFAKKFKIPYRSVTNWETEGTGGRKPPEYLTRLIELVMILENEIDQLRSGQLEIKEENAPNETRKEIFKTIDEYLTSDMIDLSCQDCKYDRTECKNAECEWENYKYYEEYRKIIEEELKK